MKRISKDKIEFDCIVRSITVPTLTAIHDGDKIEVIINYYDTQDDINLVMTGSYKAEHLASLQEAYKNMETINIILEVKTKDEKEKQ
jgi:TusA-related sulfurtransferase